MLSKQSYLPISKIRGHENREQLYGIAKVTGGEVGPKIVCKARNYGTWKVTHRNEIVIGEIFCHYGDTII
ncbi:hypothetical protein [Lysinibacillus fusiformis]|uniref:hypothetical protein n=1 Tax=Lysinibacillus fusiformis TaxID=28031 RepID=UPI0037232A34